MVDQMNGTSTAAPKFSLSLGGTSSANIKTKFQLSKPKLPSSASGTNTPNGRSAASSGRSTPLKRPASSLLSDADHDQDGLDTDSAISSHQISAFGHGVKTQQEKDAECRRREAENRIIPKIPDRDWREESKRRRRQQRMHEEQANEAKRNANVAAMEAKEKATIQYGLTVSKASAEVDDDMSDDELSSPAKNQRRDEDEPVGQERTEVRTADEEALAALLGQRQTGQETATIRPPTPPQNEEAAFREAYSSAPASATLDDYAATPVEGFGAAVLRGYLRPGQSLEALKAKEPQGKDKKGKQGEVKRRPGLLGLGAKESGLGIELGAWGKAKGGQQPDIYAPVALKNKKTGEVITEAEMKAQLDKQALEGSQSRSRSRLDGASSPSKRKRIEGGPDRDERRRNERERDKRDRKDRGTDDRRRGERERDHENWRRERTDRHRRPRSGKDEVDGGDYDRNRSRDRDRDRDPDSGRRRGRDRDRVRDREAEREHEHRPSDSHRRRHGRDRDSSCDSSSSSSTSRSRDDRSSDSSSESSPDERELARRRRKHRRERSERTDRHGRPRSGRHHHGDSHRRDRHGGGRRY